MVSIRLVYVQNKKKGQNRKVVSAHLSACIMFVTAKMTSLKCGSGSRQQELFGTLNGLRNIPMYRPSHMEHEFNISVSFFKTRSCSGKTGNVRNNAKFRRLRVITVVVEKQ